MKLNRNTLYTILFSACMAGYIWIYVNISYNTTAKNSFDVCFIKHVSGMPCPSCGSTRSVISLYKGNLTEAIRINPMGLLLACILFISPLWILSDILRKRNTLFELYVKTEIALKKPGYAIPLSVLVIINWIWNITKGL